jgi:hypothetical protein
MRPHPDRDVPERTGILVIRVWLEQEPPGQLRARLTEAVDLGEVPTTFTTAADVRAICDAVEAWLQRFLETLGGDGGVTRR